MPAALRFASVTAVALDDFEAALIPTGETDIFVRRAGSGPPLLLLHGFPQTHLMWRDVAPRQASRYTVVCADLRGYGQSGCPASTPDHAPYAKRAMAADMVAAMARLGFDRSGSRWPATTVAAASPTGSRSTIRGASTASRCSTCSRPQKRGRGPTRASPSPSGPGLAQPAPLPERLLAAVPDAVIDDALGGWGSPAGVFDDGVRAAYVAALRDPDRLHAICEEYRAAATLDRAHDEADQARGRRITCPLLALWSAQGPLGTWYEAAGGR
jgi:haloacetate dehalogenase